MLSGTLRRNGEEAAVGVYRAPVIQRPVKVLAQRGRDVAAMGPAERELAVELHYELVNVLASVSRDTAGLFGAAVRVEWRRAAHSCHEIAWDVQCDVTSFGMS